MAGGALRASSAHPRSALRRRAEKAARDGDHAGARALADQAVQAAAGDPGGEALAMGTAGLVALFGGAYPEAERLLGDVRARLATLEVHDPEEVARVDHNRGVVALSRGHDAEAVAAFERALAAKRSLGDRAGMRSCLLNLGLALAKTSRLDDADRALDEALVLARALGQTAGRGWVLAALADVAVRRGDAAAADRRIGEAAALEQALPAAVVADLAILRGPGGAARRRRGPGLRSGRGHLGRDAEHRRVDRCAVPHHRGRGIARAAPGGPQGGREAGDRRDPPRARRRRWARRRRRALAVLREARARARAARRSAGARRMLRR